LVCLIAGARAQPADGSVPDDPRGLRAEAHRLFNAARYEEAWAVGERALAAAEQQMGPEHPFVAEVLSTLGFIRLNQRHLPDAERIFKRQLAIREKTDGPQQKAVSSALESLLRVYELQARHAEAEPIYKRLVELAEKAWGPEDVNVAQRLQNLAQHYSGQGRYRDAEVLLRRVLATYEKVFGPDLPQTGNALVLLADAVKRNRPGEAQQLYQRALSIFEPLLGPDDLKTLMAGNALADFYLLQGEADKAEPYYRRSLKKSESIYGKSSTEIANISWRLGWVAYLQSRFADAQALMEQALSIYERKGGDTHPATAITRNNLAWVYVAQENWQSAYEFFRRSAEVFAERRRRGKDAIGLAVASGVETEVTRQSQVFTALIKAAIRLVARDTARAQELTAATFEAAQWARDSEAAASLGQMTARVAKGDAALGRLVRLRQDLVADWHNLDRLTLAALAQPAEQRDASADDTLRSRLAQIASRVGDIDRSLTKDFPEYARFANPTPISIVDVQQQLHADEALIVFLDTWKVRELPSETFAWFVTKTDARWVRTRLRSRALADAVGALRCGLDAGLWHDASGWPEETQEQAQHKTEQLARRRYCWKLLNAEPATELVGLAKVQVLPFDLSRAHELYQALLGPVEDMIKGKRLIIVPSGPLTSLPFNVLVTDAPGTAVPEKLADYRKAAWLGARQPITVLPSVASLKALRQFAKSSQATKPYLGIGNPLLEGPQNDLRWGAYYKAQAELARSKRCSGQMLAQQLASARGPRSVRGFGSLFRGAHADIEHVRLWTPLPETADELCEVGRRLGVPHSDILLGDSATETRVKELSEQGRLADYAILHFATHGALTGQVEGSAEPGLILTPPAKGTSEPQVLQRDDGFLIASEIAALKLDADWVILSACNTAGGQSDNAEALSGMARAFFYAGARTLLVSHWEVGSDAAVRLTTRALAEMATKHGIGRAEAMRVSMRALIEDGTLADAHPSRWAPFVVVGEGGDTQQSAPSAPALAPPSAPVLSKATSTVKKKAAGSKRPVSDWRSEIWRQ
jgi:CHAT domain-containing protein/tetratricopeptide (TPR) repeat protein